MNIARQLIGAIAALVCFCAAMSSHDALWLIAGILWLIDIDIIEAHK